MAAEKRCSRCGKVKPLTAFYRKALSRDGRQCWCRDCMVERHLRLKSEGYLPADLRLRFPLLHDAEWVRRQYLGLLRSPKEIAGELGCTPSAVYAALRFHGIDTIPHTFRATLRARATKQKVRA